MSNYSIHVQKTKAGKFCVCFVSQYNGKLVLRGEPLNRRIHAFAIAGAIGIQMGVTLPTEVLPADHKWPRNAGPAKKKAARKRVVMQGLGAYSLATKHPLKTKKKAAKKAPVQGYTHIGSKGPINFYANNDSIGQFAKGKKTTKKK